MEDFCGRWWRILVETFCERFCVVDFLDFFVVAICVVFMWKILVGEWTAVCDPDKYVSDVTRWRILVSSFS